MFLIASHAILSNKSGLIPLLWASVLKGLFLYSAGIVSNFIMSVSDLYPISVRVVSSHILSLFQSCEKNSQSNADLEYSTHFEETTHTFLGRTCPAVVLIYSSLLKTHSKEKVNVISSAFKSVQDSLCVVINCNLCS